MPRLIMEERRPKYLWNHRIHQYWADEDLTFWRLAFFPRYRRTQVLETIKEVMRSEEVSSYAVYETLGLFDIFVRTWLPSQALERFEKALNDALQGEYLQLLESFTVTRILRHHVWDGPNGELREPHAEDLARLSDTEIARINQGELERGRRKELETAKIIAKLPDGDGVKFFTIITSPVYSTTFEGRTRLVENLLKILEDSGIEEPSLYEGSGFGRFILMGRAPSEDFFAIPRLVGTINDLGIYEALTARPYTHVCSDQGVMVCVDEIPTTAAQESIDVENLLNSSETHEFEVKGSLRLNLARWLSDPKNPRLENDDDVVNDGVIKAIVGMLNADGGRVVIGALERGRKFGKYDAETHPLLQKFGKVGKYVILGVDEEDAFRAKGWDGFLLQLQDLIGARIEPSPAGLISIDEEWAAGRTLCVISIQPSTSTWFYRRLGPRQAVKFYVREDGRTVAYAGSDADSYKRANPRG